MKSIFLSVFLCFVVAGASAQQDNLIKVNAPAGFTWGETKQQIESKGIAVIRCLETNFGLECSVDSAPKEISFVEEYGLVFIEGQGLQGVVMDTDNFTDDPTGYKGKQLYDEVKQNLISKYGQPESREFIGEALYDEPDEFYQCLEHAGCGRWISFWDGGNIRLQISGLRRGTGYLRIGYRAKDFSELLDKQEKAESSKDQDNGDAQLNSPGAHAPAGFTWGDTKQQIESKGIVVKDCSDEEIGLQCVADSAPKEISFVQHYGLIFIEGYGLQQVVMLTDDFTDDPSGYEGKQLYDEVKQSLISKYGQPKLSDEYTGRSVYDEPDKFYQCLAYAGCGSWSSSWFGEGAIRLGIEGSKRGTGHIGIAYASKDRLDIAKKEAARAEKEAAESSKDIEAL